MDRRHVRSKVMRPADVLSMYARHDGSLAQFLRARVAAKPEGEFLICGDRRWTWAAFEQRVLSLATALDAAGIQKGDRVVVALRNSDRYIALFFALARLGAILVPVNPEFGAGDFEYVFRRIAPELVVYGEHSREAVTAASAATSVAPPLMTIEGDVEGAEDLWARCRSGESVPAAGSGDDTCLIMFTSGTTGFPKGVMHRQRSFVLTGEAFIERMQLQPEDRMLCVLPLFHINALFYSLGGAVAAGATLVVVERFSASGFWTTAAACGATQVNLIAAMGSILIRRSRSEFTAKHRLTKVYVAPLQPDVHETFTREFGIETVREGYGMTEIPGFTHQPVDEPPRIGTMGRLSRHPLLERFGEARVVDAEGRDLPPGRRGELLACTPVLMQGYFADPEGTEAAFLDGWFRTGDIVSRDAEGNFTFVARGRDIIRRRGENISGAELDRIIAGHPQVLEVAAIPIPSPLGEDDILVAIVPVPQSGLRADELAAWFASNLPRAKQPRYIAFVEALPHSAAHRVEKFKLREDAGLRARAIDLFPEDKMARNS